MSQQRSVIITGGGSGIGRAIALRLASDGWQITLAGRRPAPLEAVAAEVEKMGGKALAVPCDVTSPDDVEALFLRFHERFGRLDLLFNNAGMAAPSETIDQISWQNWSDMLSVNVNGSVLCACAAFAAMRQQDPPGGRIINNGSISAHVPRPGSAPYTVSKHAITGLTKSLALDGRAFNIACGQIDIGNVATDLAAAIATGMPQADGSFRPEPLFDIAHVADAVSLMANLPLDANVPFMTIMATGMPLMGRG